MKKEFIEKTAYAAAFSSWFSAYERERRHQKKRKGARLIGFPDPPTNPENIAATIDRIGVKKTLRVLQVHRSTVARWLSGACVIPRPCWLLLSLMAEGKLPDMSDDWKDFRFDGDRLLHSSGLSYSALEIAGWPYQISHARALARRIAELEKQNAHLLRVGVFDAANDAISA